MKKMFGFTLAIFLSAAAVAQSPDNDVPKPVLTTSMVSAAITITGTDVVINPNPVKGQNFSLELQNLQKGKYNIYIFDKEGHKYLVKTLNTDGGTSTEAIDLPKEITTGTYILQVLSKTARFSKKMIVE